MQLQVVAGRGGGGAGGAGGASAVGVGTPQYAQYARHQPAPRGYAVCAASSAATNNGAQQQSSDGMQSAVKFTERGVPEGAASVSQSDGHQMMSPTSNGQNCMQINAGGTSSGGGGMPQTGSTPPGAVFYAMNV